MPHEMMPRDYEAESDLYTLERAAEITADSERVARAKAFALEKAAKLVKLAGDGRKQSAAEELLMKGYRSL